MLRPRHQKQGYPYLKTQILRSAIIRNHDMCFPKKDFIFKTSTFLKISLKSFKCFKFLLVSNESETEEDEVEKPPMKKRKGQKKAPQEKKVIFIFS